MSSAITVSTLRRSERTAAQFWIVLVLVFAMGAWVSFSLSGPIMISGVHRLDDVWFDADIGRVFANLTDRFSDHYRTAVHPLTSLLLSTPTVMLKHLGLPIELAARITIAAGAGSLAIAFFYLCARLTDRTLDGFIYTLLLMSSASFLFFATVFELYAWGAFSILAAVLSAMVEGRHRAFTLVAGSAVSLSFTVTNWMAGLAAVALAEPVRRAALYTVFAFALVAALTAVQSNLYPKSGKFLYLGEEQKYAKIDIREKIQAAPMAFFVDPIVVPGVVSLADRDGTRVLIVQSPQDRRNLVHGVAAAIWLVLAGVGTFAAWTLWREGNGQRRMVVLLGGLIAGQLLLHIFYGAWFFLYSLHFAPLLILLAALSSTTKWRLPCLAGALLLSGLAAWNNIAVLDQAVALLLLPQ